MLLRPSPQEIVLGRLRGRIRRLFGATAGYSFRGTGGDAVLRNEEGNGLFFFFWKTKKRPDPEDQDAGHAVPPDIRLWRIHDRRTHCRRCPYRKTETTVGGKSAHSITGVSGFSYVYRFSRHYEGGYTRAASPAYVGGKTSFQKSGSGTTSTNTAKALHRPASLCAQWLRVLRPINAIWI